MPALRHCLSSLMTLVLLGVTLLSCTDNSIDPPPPERIDTVDELLASWPNLTWTEVAPPVGSHFTRLFEIEVPLPVYHGNSGGPQFDLFLYLAHVDASRPMHVYLNGYANGAFRIGELSNYLQANQVYIGHRYMGGYGPEPPIWEHMNAEQASGDAHRIIEWLKSYYTGPYVSSGGSKSGIAAICHRYFYPNDVIATVPYVAPIMLDTADARFDDFLLNQVGDQACRDRLFAFQRALLLKRDSLMPMLQTYVGQQGYTFRLGLEATWEMSIMEFPFFFWQYGVFDCNQMLDSTATTQQLFDAMQQMANVDWLDDARVDYYAPAYYQIFTELGYYRLIDDHLADLLQASPKPSYSMLTPLGVGINYSPQLMQDVLAWLQSDATNFVFIYGANDPYTSTAVLEPIGTNCISVVEPGFDHGVKIPNLTTRQSEVFDSLDTWLGVTIDRGAVSGESSADIESHFRAKRPLGSE